MFAANDKPTLPFPVPLAPDVIVTHPACEAAVQAHVGADAVTATEPAPPDAGTF